LPVAGYRFFAAESCGYCFLMHLGGQSPLQAKPNECCCFNGLYCLLAAVRVSVPESKCAQSDSQAMFSFSGRFQIIGSAQSQPLISDL
jgi:hypothetical protein